MKLFIFKCFSTSRLFLIICILNFPTLSSANEFDSLISKYNNYSEKGDLHKSTKIFFELIKKYPSTVPVDILLNQGHLFIMDYNSDGYHSVHKIMTDRLKNHKLMNPKLDNEFMILREAVGAMASYSQTLSTEEYSYNWLDYFRETPTSFPTNHHELYLKNISDLQISDVFTITGEYSLVDAILTKLFVLNSMINGQTNKEIKKRFLWKALLFYTISGRERLSSILMEKIDESYNERQILKNNYTFQGSSKEQELIYYFVNGDISSAKKLIYNHFEEKSNGKLTPQLVDYQLLFQVSTFCYVIDDIEFLTFARDKFKEMKVGVDFSDILDIAILSTQYNSNKDNLITENHANQIIEKFKSLIFSRTAPARRLPRPWQHDRCND